MKRIYLAALIATLALTACEEQGGSPQARIAPITDQPDDVTIGLPSITPGLPTAPADPDPLPPVVVTPAPTPSPSPTPAPTPVPPSLPGNTVASDSYGGYTCAKLATGEVWCSDGTTGQVVAARAVKVVVANGIACALQVVSAVTYQDRQPSSCTSLEAAGCTMPPTYYQTSCWTPSAPVPTVMRMQQQISPQPYTSWVSGPQNIYRDAQNKMGIEQAVFNLQTNPYGRRERVVQTVGVQISATKYLIE